MGDVAARRHVGLARVFSFLLVCCAHYRVQERNSVLQFHYLPKQNPQRKGNTPENGTYDGDLMCKRVHP